MAHARGSRFRGRSARRQTSWNEGPFGVLTTAATSILAIPTAQTAVAEGLTIVRFRGTVTLGLSLVTVALDGFARIGLGLCIVSQNAADVGATAIPGLIADIGWDGWLWHSLQPLFGATTTLESGQGTSNVRVEIDSKAMRKFKATDVVVAMVETQDEVGTSQIRVNWDSRMLLKLS